MACVVTPPGACKAAELLSTDATRMAAHPSCPTLQAPRHPPLHACGSGAGPRAVQRVGCICMRDMAWCILLLKSYFPYRLLLSWMRRLAGVLSTSRLHWRAVRHTLRPQHDRGCAGMARHAWLCSVGAAVGVPWGHLRLRYARRAASRRAVPWDCLHACIACWLADGRRMGTFPLPVMNRALPARPQRNSCSSLPYEEHTAYVPRPGYLRGAYELQTITVS